jgi:hypothetical protein
MVFSVLSVAKDFSLLFEDCFASFDYAATVSGFAQDGSQRHMVR